MNQVNRRNVQTEPVSNLYRIVMGVLISTSLGIGLFFVLHAIVFLLTKH